MPDNALDVGFADFVAVLLVETLDSIVASHTSQEERLRSLEAAAGLTPEEFASTGITEEVLAAMLVQLFPDSQGGTSIVAGGPVPGKDALEELAVDLTSKDTDGGVLTAIGVTHVYAATRLYLATRQLDAIREVHRRGVPRVLVDGGTLRARLNFTAVRAVPDEAPAPSIAPVTAASIRSHLVAFDAPIRAGVLDSIRTLRLNVASPPPPTDGGPTATTQVYGEVEIRFRTEV